MKKAFKVVSVSTNADSFGMFGHIIVARDGQAFEVSQSHCNPCVKAMRKGEVVEVEMTKGNEPLRPYETFGETFWKPLVKAPAGVVEQAWAIPLPSDQPAAAEAMPEAKPAAEQPSIDELMAYEDGQLDASETVDLFQRLIDCGLAWRLQGAYGRQAAALIKAGHCKETVAA